MHASTHEWADTDTSCPSKLVSAFVAITQHKMPSTVFLSAPTCQIQGRSCAGLANIAHNFVLSS
eukprot:3186635-Lingulodinium_polyedra.AAC.1